jgi:hypothetical protein
MSSLLQTNDRNVGEAFLACGRMALMNGVRTPGLAAAVLMPGPLLQPCVANQLTNRLKHASRAHDAKPRSRLRGAREAPGLRLGAANLGAMKSSQLNARHTGKQRWAATEVSSMEVSGHSCV